MKRSRWYVIASGAVLAAVEALPADADRAAIERAAKAAYPFGERRQWPYKQYLRARRDVLRVRFPRIYAKAGEAFYESELFAGLKR